MLLLAGSAWAATFTVTTTNDAVGADGVTSLREAVQAANASGGADTIDLPAGSYPLTLQGAGEDAAEQGDLDVWDDLVVQGPTGGLAVVNAIAITDRIFHVLAGGSLALSNLNLTGGSAAGGGGAIRNDGVLRVGDSALYGNQATYGGAIFTTGTAWLQQVTLAHNSAAVRGGALLASNGVVDARHTTVAYNEVTSGSGGGLAVGTGAVATMSHVLVANNTAFMNGPDLDGDLVSGGYNLVGLTNGWSMTGILSGNVSNVTAPLRALGTNGGSSLTLATVPGNRAIDGGSAAFAPPPFTDQRGRARVFNGRIDIGAYEFQHPLLAVNTTNDDFNFLDDQLSLREAVVMANVQANENNLITLSNATYRFTRTGGGEDQAVTGDLDLRGRVKITGQGAYATVIDADAVDRVFYVDNNVVAQLEDLTVRGGDSSVGSGIYNQGNLTLLRCRVVDNGAGAYGGGIEQWTGMLGIYQSVIAGNGAGSPGGGGIDIVGGTVQVVSSTISGNSSPVGAGVYRYGGEVGLYFCTVAGNVAGATGGGLYLQGAVEAAYLQGSLLADNVADSGADVAGVVDSLGYNYVEDFSASSGYIATDLGGGDPLLLPLGDYGGPTESHVLQRGSPLINRGDPGLTNGIDQRGLPRVRGRAIDIGSTEEQTPDEDVDGMPDEWESASGLNPTNAADGALDADGDAVANSAEFIADTDPTNGLSYFHISDAAVDAAQTALTFPSSTARVYRLQAAADPLAPWQDLGVAVTGQMHSTTLVDAAAVVTSRALRVTVRLP